MRTTIPIICLSLIVLVSCGKNDKKVTDSRQAPLKDYSVLTLVPKSVTVHKNFPATIEGQQVIEIRPMISGYIKEINVNEGDRVNKGQILFKISNPQYEQSVITAKAKVNSSEADVNTAKMEIEKVKPLVEKQIVSEYRLKSAELTLQSKEASLAEAKAELTNAEANLGYTIIKSPQDGIIGTIPYKTGALVSSNSTEALTTLSDIGKVFAYFSENEKDLLNFLMDSPGITMEEKIKNLPEATLILANLKEYEYKGRIELASGLISTETGSATFKAIFPNPAGIIRSGSSASVSIPEVMDSVFVIPQSATYELQNKRFVYILNSDDKVKSVSFNSIPSDDGKFFLVSEGLKAGNKIVIEGVASLRDGTVIKPKDTDAMTFYRNTK